MNRNPLTKTIGIIGGGQLGKMMILEAKKLGFRIITLDPAADCPSHSISDEHIVAAFDDRGAIMALAGKSDVITYEFEHIGVEILLELENQGYTVYPTARSLKVIQNKLSQKDALAGAQIPVPDYRAIDGIEAMRAAGQAFGYPYMLKSCTGGYDGKGNALVAGERDIPGAYESLGAGKLPLMAERFVDYQMEISVLCCRAIDGSVAVYPVGRNTHINSILEETRVPAELPDAVAHNAMDLANRVMEVFNGVGMFCVEMFVDGQGGVYINEVAPRPHNSGHYSIEGCVTSQFAQHIRAVTGLPLGDTSLLRPVVMRNLLGEEGCEGRTVVEGVEQALAIPGVMVHIYGKGETKPRRKMGHLTVTADTLAEAAEKAEKAKAMIRIISRRD